MPGSAPPCIRSPQTPYTSPQGVGQCCPDLGSKDLKRFQVFGAADFTSPPEGDGRPKLPSDSKEREAAVEPCGARWVPTMVLLRLPGADPASSPTRGCPGATPAPSPRSGWAWLPPSAPRDGRYPVGCSFCPRGVCRIRPVTAIVFWGNKSLCTGGGRGASLRPQGGQAAMGQAG